MPLHHYVDIEDCAFGLADRHGDSPFQEGEPERQLLGDHTPQPPWSQVYSRMLEKKVWLLVEPRIQGEQFGFCPSHGTLNWLYTLTKYWMGHRSLPNKSTCVLWIQKSLMTVSVKVLSESELGSHCRQYVSPVPNQG